MSAGPATLSAATRRTILLLSFATFSSMASQRICDAMLPELSRVFAVSLSQTAQVISLFAVVYGLAQLFYGPLGDALGKFRIIAYATLGCSLGNLVAVFSNSLDLLLVSRGMVALGAAAIIPLTLAWVGDTVDGPRLQETIARVGLGTTLGIGSGPLVGGVLTDLFGWRWAFGVLAALFCVVGGMLVADLRRQQSAPEGTAAAVSGDRPSFIGQSLSILAKPWARTILLVGVAEGATGFGALAIWASHLHLVMGFSLSTAGAVVALFGAGGMLYMATARHLIRQFSQRGLALLGGSLIGVCTFVIAYTPYVWLTVPASLLAGWGFFAFHNVMQTNVAQMAPNARGTGVSLFAVSMFAGQSVGVQVAANLVERWGSGNVIMLGGGALCATTVFFWQALRRREAFVQ